jgi:hypothetical protein
MKWSVIIILFAFGMVVTIVGAFFKLMHWPGNNFMLGFGLAVQAIALISLIVKLLKKDKIDKSINK